MKTFEELKAENAVAASEPVVPQPTAETEVNTGETSVEEPEQDAEPAGDETEGSSESWMQTDEKEAKFTDSDIAAAKRKLRAKLEREHNTEVERIKAELEVLKARPKLAEPAVMPKLADFDYDEDAHHAAIAKWYESVAEAKVQAVTQSQVQETRQREARAKFESSVDDHYNRAMKLIQDHGITPEVYQESDKAIRATIEKAMPGRGDMVTDQLIAALGEGSEKVMFFIGRNKAKQAELQNALLTDISGLSAMAVLVDARAEYAKSKTISRAPAPATRIQGDNTTTIPAKEREMMSAYKKAHDKGNIQDAFDIKRRAKLAGINPKNW